jgi:hypothetical protein
MAAITGRAAAVEHASSRSTACPLVGMEHSILAILAIVATLAGK